MNISIGNLSSDTTEKDLTTIFESFGQIQSISIINNRFIRSSKSSGFVKMSSRKEARIAINKLNGHMLKGRTITVSEARPRCNKRELVNWKLGNFYCL